MSNNARRYEEDEIKLRVQQLFPKNGHSEMIIDEGTDHIGSVMVHLPAGELVGCTVSELFEGEQFRYASS